MQHALTLSIEGAATIAGFGSADPFANTGYQSTSTKSWDGRALAILRGAGTPAMVKITVRGDGLRTAVATLRLERTEIAG